MDTICDFSEAFKIQTIKEFRHYDAEMYSKISALVKLARKLVTYNERN